MANELDIVLRHPVLYSWPVCDSKHVVIGFNSCPPKIVSLQL